MWSHKRLSTTSLMAGSSFANDRSLQLPDADLVLVVMRLLPDEVRAYVQLMSPQRGIFEWLDSLPRRDIGLKASGQWVLRVYVGLSLGAEPGCPTG